MVSRAVPRQLWAIVRPFCAVLEASWSIVAAFVAGLGCLGRHLRHYRRLGDPLRSSKRPGSPEGAPRCVSNSWDGKCLKHADDDGDDDDDDMDDDVVDDDVPWGCVVQRWCVAFWFGSGVQEEVEEEAEEKYQQQGRGGNGRRRMRKGRGQAEGRRGRRRTST